MPAAAVLFVQGRFRDELAATGSRAAVSIGSRAMPRTVAFEEGIARG